MKSSKKIGHNLIVKNFNLDLENHKIIDVVNNLVTTSLSKQFISTLKLLILDRRIHCNYKSNMFSIYHFEDFFKEFNIEFNYFHNMIFRNHYGLMINIHDNEKLCTMCYGTMTCNYCNSSGIRTWIDIIKRPI